MPAALIGRLAVDDRARGRGCGERLLVDALQRVVDASELLGCLGIIVDAKDEDAERFYVKYDFITLHSEGWPRRGRGGRRPSDATGRPAAAPRHGLTTMNGGKRGRSILDRNPTEPPSVAKRCQPFMAD